MVKFYVMRILDRKTTFKKVPAQLKEAVASLLSENGYSDFIFEGESGNDE